MDHDKLVDEIQSLQDWLNEHDPTSDEYGIVLERLIKLSKHAIEFDESCAKQLERDVRLDIDREKLETETNLRETEMNLKYNIEHEKIESASSELLSRRKQEKKQARIELIKTGLQILGTLALIVTTGKIEQNAIIGQHQWSLIPKGKY